MGYVKNIDYDNYPKQSDKVGKKVKVCYHYDNERYIKATECQYTFVE